MNCLTNSGIHIIDREIAARVAHEKHASVEQRRAVKDLRDMYAHSAWVNGIAAAHDGEIPSFKDDFREYAESYRVYANRAQILLDELNEEVRGVHKRL